MRNPGLSWSLTLVFAVLGVSTAGLALGQTARPASLIFACAADNDLLCVVKQNGLEHQRFDAAAEAIRAAPEGSGVLILADGYPEKTTPVDLQALDQAAAKRLRLYVEYPAALPDLRLGAPRATQWERAVVASDAFGPSLAKMRIVMIHNCRFLPVASQRVHLVSARVAGFDTAVFGLPKETWPILLEHPQREILVATTKLSHFVTGRYAPTDAWRAVWKMVFEWLWRGKAAPELKWTPTVRPTFGPGEPLPADAQRQAVRRGTEWYERGGLLVHESWKNAEPPPKKGIAPEGPFGDGRHGILEGHISTILADGSQPRRLLLRADCNSESAMGFAMRGLVDDHAPSRAVAANLLDFVYFRSPLQQGPRNDPTSASYGLLGWYSLPQGCGIYYGDDNAKAMLATTAVAGTLASDRWDEPLLRAILGNFRTSGQLGFRTGSLGEESLQKNGWQYYAARRFVNPHPHYESWLWACYLWLYDKTRFEPLLDRARQGIRLTIRAYPKRWHWTNNQQQIERGRMILPLAWLIRVEDRPEYRAWLNQMAGELLAHQAPCGALQEQVVAGARSNEEYGTGETSLIQHNDDPVADMLYVSNFALLGLNEAVAATGDAKLARAADKLAEFLVRIQTRSEKHPDLDGAWYRCCDFKRWEYWASNADAGWGAWCTETGWTQGWILAGLALRERKTSLWELTAKSKIGAHFEKYRKLMIPDEAWAKTVAASEQAHLAVGKTVGLAIDADPRYPGSGPDGLVDGLVNGPDVGTFPWMGFEGPDLVATVDLDKPVSIRRLGANFYQSVPIGVFLPRRVEFAVSDDGKSFRSVATVANDVPADRKGPLTKTFWADTAEVNARYVKVRAVNVGTIPDWHPARGRKAWLFVDEILVR